jgi:hypothetical protein
MDREDLIMGNLIMANPVRLKINTITASLKDSQLASHLREWLTKEDLSHLRDIVLVNGAHWNNQYGYAKGVAYVCGSEMPLKTVVGNIRDLVGGISIYRVAFPSTTEAARLLLGDGLELRKRISEIAKLNVLGDTSVTAEGIVTK